MKVGGEANYAAAIAKKMVDKLEQETHQGSIVFVNALLALYAGVAEMKKNNPDLATEWQLCEAQGFSSLSCPTFKLMRKTLALLWSHRAILNSLSWSDWGLIGRLFGHKVRSWLGSLVPFFAPFAPVSFSARAKDDIIWSRPAVLCMTVK